MLTVHASGSSPVKGHDKIAEELESAILTVSISTLGTVEKLALVWPMRLVPSGSSSSKVYVVSD